MGLKRTQMIAVFMYLPSSVVFAITLFVCCRLHSHPQCIHCVFFLLRPKFCNGFTGWKILKRAKEASNSERLVSLGWELVQCARHHTEVVHICAVNCDCKLGSRIVIWFRKLTFLMQFCVTFKVLWSFILNLINRYHFFSKYCEDDFLFFVPTCDILALITGKHAVFFAWM